TAATSSSTAKAAPLPPRARREARLAACRAAIAYLVQTPRKAQTTDPEQLTQQQEAAGRLTQDYRKRIDLLDEAEDARTPETQADAPDAVRERRQRYLVEMDLRLQTLRVERDTLYAERHAQRINDEVLRTLVAELDLSEVSLRRRIAAARRTLGVPARDDGG
ncbi:MAG TPA: Na+/H+ antiporter, partial [Burkholderiaceae bacterium]|nr:Na+/H+ antiporter [Burkholderiaceae bacterium]